MFKNHKIGKVKLQFDFWTELKEVSWVPKALTGVDSAFRHAHKHF